MSYYDAPDTGTWNASQEERDRLRQENYEKNKEGLQNALNESQRRQDEERETNPGIRGNEQYSWTGQRPAKNDKFVLSANQFHSALTLIANDFVFEKDGVVVYRCKYGATQCQTQTQVQEPQQTQQT